jgi:hypothetical protein
LTTTSSNPRIPRAAYASLCSALGDRHLAVAPLNPGGPIEVVIDHTHKFLVTSSLGRKYVLIVSNPEFPLTVSKAVSGLQEARSALGARTQDVVEMPVHHGDWNGVSYALWTYRFPLSHNRLYLYAQKRLLIPKMTNWLSAVAQETLRSDLTPEELNANFTEPLHVLQHSDLWRGNVLTRGPMALLNPNGNGFVVIDWGGARVAGYPFIDLLRFIMSFNLSPKGTAHQLNSMRRVIRCEPEDVVSHVVCSYGKLYQEIDNFPRQNFINLCESSIRYLMAAGLCRDND